MRVYAVGDVHGRLDCLTDILRRIAADLVSNAPKSHRIVFLGDYSDRGPNSRGVIELLSRLAQIRDFIFLLGNHDEWLADFLREPDLVGDNFLQWGGIETLASYGIEVGRQRKTNHEISSELVARIPDSHRQFLSNLAPYHAEGDFFFCHAGVRPGVPLEGQALKDLIWIREEFLSHTGSFGKVVVHGHTPELEVEFRPNRINIDTCAYYSGILTCLVLEGSGYRLLQTAGGRLDH